MAYKTLHNTDSLTSIPLQSAEYRRHDYDSMDRTGKISQGESWGKRKLIIGTVAVLLVAAIAGGITAGVILNRDKSENSTSTGNSSSGDGTKVSGDPSKFTKDPRLHVSFPGMCYTPPNGANYPACGDKLEDIIVDIQLMSQVTKTLRMYGADCSASDLVLNAIDLTKVDLKVYLGLYFEMADPEIFDRQLDETLRVLQKYGSKNVLGITVGNEVILQAQQGNQFTTRQATQQVLDNVKTTRDAVKALNLEDRIPIGTGDAGSQITLALAEGVDYIMSNNQPFFSGNTIDESADWTITYTDEDTPSVALQASNKPTLIGEIGWPTDAFANGSLAMNGSAASIENAQILLDTFVCQANQRQTHKYFWFQSFNAWWTVWMYGGAEPFWGLWDENKKLKEGLTLPDCTPNFDNTASVTID